MDNMENIHLKLENVKYLFSPDLFEELFCEAETNEFNGGSVNKGSRDGMDVRGVGSLYKTSTHSTADGEALKKNAEECPTQPKLTWAEIVKGDNGNFKMNMEENRYSFPPLVDFPPLLETFEKIEKLKGKRLPPIGEGRKMSEKNKKGAEKKSFGNETMKEYSLF